MSVQPETFKHQVNLQWEKIVVSLPQERRHCNVKCLALDGFFIHLIIFIGHKMSWSKETMVIWWILTLAAVACVPVLENDLLSNFANLKNSHLNAYYEQASYTNKKGDLTHATPGTNFEEGQMNKAEKFLELLETILVKTESKAYLRQYIHDSAKKLRHESERIKAFRQVIDGMLMSIDPAESDIESLEEKIENEYDYGAILFDLIDSFSDQSSLHKNDIKSITQDDYFRQRFDPLILPNKLVNMYSKERSGTADLTRPNKAKSRLLRKLKEDILGLKKRSKRVIFDDGKILSSFSMLRILLMIELHIL